ncbi:MAG: hypothetical protein AAGD25_02300 [Cyanobacteria bacterium P01_F01_bin.150]
MRLLSAKQWIQVTLGVVLTLFLLWGASANHPARAQLDTTTSFRLSRIESDIRTLRTEIQQVETALDRVQRASGDRIIGQELIPDSRGRQDDAIAQSNQQRPVSSDPLDLEAAQAELMFDQLATLVIETRQDMFALQEKVEQLEHNIRSTSK